MSSPKLTYRARFERTANSILPSSWFATYELLPAQRLAAWQESMDVFVEPTLSSSDNSEAFSGEIEGYLLDDIIFTRAHASGQKFDRRSAKIARDSIDHYMVQLFFEGHVEMNVHRRVVRNSPGQIMAFDLGDIMDSFNASFDLINIIIPRSRLAPLLASPDSLHGVMPALDRGPGYLLAGYVRTLYRAVPTLSPADSVPAARALLELIAAAFNDAVTGKRSEHLGSHQSQLMRAQLFIRENLGLAELSIDTIARSAGLSRSALYELFEPVGGVAGYVRELRLRKCLTEIASPRHAGAQISEIAYRWGFSNPAVFARAFRRRFGRSPTDARETAFVNAQRGRTVIDPRAGNRLHEEWIATLT